MKNVQGDKTKIRKIRDKTKYVWNNEEKEIIENGIMKGEKMGNEGGET